MLGVGGQALHGWFAHDIADRNQLTANEVLLPELERLGAMVMGNDSFEHAQAAWGPHPPFEVPIFVLTHRARADDVREGTTFHFVTDGFETALKLAEDAAGEKDVGLHGGGSVQQGLRSGALDELQVHIIPVLLGGGRRLFENFDGGPIILGQPRVAEGVDVTHLKYRIQARTLLDRDEVMRLDRRR
jgi:dihydrofolate reductase